MSFVHYLKEKKLNSKINYFNADYIILLICLKKEKIFYLIIFCLVVVVNTL